MVRRSAHLCQLRKTVAEQHAVHLGLHGLERAAVFHRRVRLGVEGLLVRHASRQVNVEQGLRLGPGDVSVFRRLQEPVGKPTERKRCRTCVRQDAVGEPTERKRRRTRVLQEAASTPLFPRRANWTVTGHRHREDLLVPGRSTADRPGWEPRDRDRRSAQRESARRLGGRPPNLQTHLVRRRTEISWIAPLSLCGGARPVKADDCAFFRASPWTSVDRNPHGRDLVAAHLLSCWRAGFRENGVETACREEGHCPTRTSYAQPSLRPHPRKKGNAGCRNSLGDWRWGGSCSSPPANRRTRPRLALPRTKDSASIPPR